MYTRAERKAQICEWLRGQRWGCPISVIGRGVGLAVTPYLRSLLVELAREGLVVVSEHVFVNGTVGYLYSSSEVVRR